MQVVKKINNNAAVCIDNQGNELIAIAKGIGFKEVPYEIEDLSIIQRTYYDMNCQYYELLNIVPMEFFEVSAEIVQLLRDKKDSNVNSNLIFILADHINFAIERCKKGIHIDSLMQYEIEHLYEDEYAIGVESLKIIRKRLNYRLPKNEVGNIALHLINAQAITKTINNDIVNDEIINNVMDIIADFFNLHIDKKRISYSRFISHLYYLFKRGKNNKIFNSENNLIFADVVEQYPRTYECVIKINEYLNEELNTKMNNEESLYLILHINRLCVRADCYRKGITQ